MKTKEKPLWRAAGEAEENLGYFQDTALSPACQVFDVISYLIRRKIAWAHLYRLQEAYLPRPFTQARSLRLDRTLLHYEGVCHACN